VHPHHGAVRIDGDERRPGAYGIGAPDAELPIVQDRMRGVESNRRVANALGDSFGGVLPAMHTDDGDRIAEPLLELPQLRKHMDAVDSAVGPEVEEQQLAAEIGERESPAVGVQPVERIREVGSTNGWRGDRIGHGRGWGAVGPRGSARRMNAQNTSVER
jgi:hypothetical protein